MASRHAELQAEVRDQVDTLRASRRRLVESADVERRRLAVRLSEGPTLRLRRLSTTLGAGLGNDDPHGSPAESRSRVTRARIQVDRTIEDLEELAQGLHPPALRMEGLALALRELAEHLPFPVDLDLADGRFPPEIDVGIYYMCAEGLANAAKHSNASRAAVVIRVSATAATIELSDDGSGGADPLNGSGLRGLTDRIEALGGWLAVDSPPGAGTRLTAVLPLGG
jgi:signal transduction histidine kinase